MALTQVSTSGIKNATIATADIADNAVTFDKVQDIPEERLVGRVSSGSGIPEHLNQSQVIQFLGISAGANQTTINNNADNRILTGTGTANTIQGESQLLFDGNYLYIKAPDTGNRYFFGETQNDKSAQLSLYNSADQQKVRIAAGDGSGEGTTFFNGGKVGIGTASPTGSLHVKSNVTTNAMFETTSGSGAYCQYALGASGAGLGYLGHSNQLCGSPTTGNLALRFEGTALEFAKGTAIKARITNDGLCFGADTAAANALDDYEEGTFTPTMTYNTLQQAPQGTFAGQYQKVGNCVHFQARFTLTDEGSGIDNIRLTNLPFTPNTSSFTHPMATFFAINGVNTGDADKMIVAQLQTSAYVFYVVGIHDSDNYGAFHMNMTDDSAIFGCYGHYYTSS